MQAVSTTKMSSKGQVVILGEGDVATLKTITPPRSEEFEEIVGKARAQARSAGMTPDDLVSALRGSRAAS